ncbi:TIGR01777 family oxidoreductase [Pseudodesulfovibrio sp.]|uniref:TIGR01777 family oxidoreductase n=1 Tax=unclassified Pseudodesulfovibrio TaxID=2661612 RepID=UPI003AFFE52E
MRAIIVGGTGFIGRNLVTELMGNGWEIVVLSRAPGRVAQLFDKGVIGMRSDNGDWPDMLGPSCVVVNLVGDNIAAGRWTSKKKQRILNSRLEAGDRILRSIRLAEKAPAAVIQASAIGFYGPQGNDPVDEYSPSGTGFLADVCRQWEASTDSLDEMGIRRCIIRTGMVLGRGGALERMLPPFRYFLGGPPGTGEQGVSWIHMADQVAAIRFLMEHPSARGPFNLTAPTPVNFSSFAETLGKLLHRPAKLKTPAFALRALFGEMADEILLAGQFALPARLAELGFTFQYPDLAPALRDVLGLAE